MSDLEKQPSETQTTDTPATAPAVPAVQQTLDEFCIHKSASVTGLVEMISAFHSEEKKNGKWRDMPSAYAKRFEAFANRPA